MADKPDYIRVAAGPPAEPPPQHRFISTLLAHTFGTPKVFTALQTGFPYRNLERTLNVTLTSS